MPLINLCIPLLMSQSYRREKHRRYTRALKFLDTLGSIERAASVQYSTRSAVLPLFPW